VHVASWVDDLIFIMSTPEHGECASLEGGCPVCMEYHGRALKVQELWHVIAHKLNIPLSAKGNPVGQSGAFTGVAIDSFKGRFSMLPDKMASLVAARQGLAASQVSTPRLIARVRGKALHYGCAIPFIAVAAPSLSQLMHGRKTGRGSGRPQPVPLARRPAPEIAARCAHAARRLRDRQDRLGRRDPPACTSPLRRDRAVTGVTSVIAVIAVIAGIILSGPVRAARTARRRPRGQFPQ
jgi:hypothetical protein